MSGSAAIAGLYRVCVKVYGEEPWGIGSDAAAFVPVFHDWIRERSLDLVLLDVADYAHVPDGPGIMLVAHEAAFALDRADGRFGLLAQRRVPVDGGAATAIALTLRQALVIAEKLERDPRLAEKLAFDRSTIRVEANDRLLAPNSAAGFAAFAPFVREAILTVLPGHSVQLDRIESDPRDRLAVEARVHAAALAS